jgi:hypothetical protein
VAAAGAREDNTQCPFAGESRGPEHKISKTTPCKVGWASLPSAAIDEGDRGDRHRKHFDVSRSLYGHHSLTIELSLKLAGVHVIE